MSEGQRWTPGPGAPSGPSAPETGQAWNAGPAPRPAYLGDPRWGIRADLPPVTSGPGAPADDGPAAQLPSSAAPAYAARASAAPAFTPPGPATPAFAAPASSAPAFGPSPFGSAPFGSAPFGSAALATAPPSRPGFAQPGIAPGSAPFMPVRTKNPGWVIAIAVLLVGSFVLLVAAAMAIPVFLNSRAKAASSELRTDLMTVASAEEAVRAQTGSYSADPDLVTAQLGGDLSSRVSIMWADATGWCGQAVPAGRQTPQLYFSSQDGISDQPCG